MCVGTTNNKTTHTHSSTDTNTHTHSSKDTNIHMPLGAIFKMFGIAVSTSLRQEAVGKHSPLRQTFHTHTHTKSTLLDMTLFKAL